MIKKIIAILYANILPILVFCLAVLASALITTSAQATINCAGYLPNSYFERIKNENRTFAGKLITLKNGTQQLQDLNSKVLLDNLSDGYILMDTYLLAKQQGKYGVTNAASEIIIPFKYDDIHTEPDIATSFIVSVESIEGQTKQGVIDRYGGWIYPLSDAHIQHAHYDADYDQDFFIVADYNNLTHHKGLTGLLDDRGYWSILPQYDSIYPLNACTGQPVYLYVRLKNKTALININNDVIIPFATEQNIELFNNWVLNTKDNSHLFLRSNLKKGSSATGLTQDIKDDIVNAQIIDAKGKLRLTSESAIVKLLYHQLYVFEQAGKFGFIDDQANIVLAAQFISYRDEGDKVWVEKEGEILPIENFIKLE